MPVGKRAALVSSQLHSRQPVGAGRIIWHVDEFIAAHAEEAAPASTKIIRAPRRLVARVELRDRIFVWLRLLDSASPALLQIRTLLATRCVGAHCI
jgi:hypothetical protein